MWMHGSGPLTPIKFQIGLILIHELLNSLHDVKICKEPYITKDK